MTKKHFERAAAIVRELQFFQGVGTDKAQVVADAFVELFSGDNPRFDRGRFLKACGL